jgi:glycosyltransferase involved in cell wall biosynthesis
MRICYLADGRYIHTHRWVDYFNQRGHEVSLFSFAPLQPHHVAALEKAGAKYFGELGPFHLKRFWRTTRDLVRLRRVLRREGIEVLHSHFLGANAWYGALTGFRPAVITVMGGDILGPDWQPRKEIREQWLTPFALRRADLITCWSHRLTEVVKRYTRPETPVEVIHGGVDLRLFYPGPKPQYLLERWQLPPNAKVVLSPRLMRPLYNLDQIALAASAVCTAEPDAYFLFAFLPEAKDDEYEARVREIASRDARTAEHIRFIGAIPHQEMADHFRLADVTVSIPSHDGTPMSVLESMACGTPTVVSNIPDYDHKYIEPEKTVLAVNNGDTPSLTNALLRLLREPERAESMILEAKRRVEESGSYEGQMSRMGFLYLSLLKHRVVSRG